MLSRLKGGIRSIPSRTQLSDFTHLHGGGLHVLPLVLSEVFAAPSPLPDETGGIVTTKREWRFESKNFKLALGKRGALKHPLLYYKESGVEGGREKSMLTQKSVLSIAGNPQGCKKCNLKRRNYVVNFVFVAKGRALLWCFCNKNTFGHTFDVKHVL